MGRQFATMVIVMVLGWAGASRAADPLPGTEVLVYTDNSPGAIVWAVPYVQASISAGYAVEVVTSENIFREAIPAKPWAVVVVADVHSETAPSYSSELVEYVEGGGMAILNRWRTAGAPTPGPNQIVVAPTAIHVWTKGQTAWSYYGTKLDEEKSAGTSIGYETKTFVNIDVMPSVVVTAPTMTPLVPGLAVAAAAADDNNVGCEEQFTLDLQAAFNACTADIEKCNRAYAPRPHSNPPFEGNPDKLAKCIINATKHFATESARAAERYLVCKDIEKAENPPSE
ncbi:MAG: hypothetical protein H6819_11340 [Phycisphaerales bacterium]|nr:hypothetical protein [Phycisphaerales bacterium]MCB9855021.1 hypothetical protein [Phycisphaerales bacterium]MCB9863462.1 hypothetical protein [Phycisphaerales bacterium]